MPAPSSWFYHDFALLRRRTAPPGEESAKAIWRSRGFELNNDVYLQRQSLQASLPMQLSESFHRDLKRLRRVTTKTAANAVHLAPLLAEWKGTATPVLLFGGRRGQLMTLDLFDNDQGNYNAAVIGTSGSGKSVLLNELAWSYRAIGARCGCSTSGAASRSSAGCDGQMIEDFARAPPSTSIRSRRSPTSTTTWRCCSRSSPEMASPSQLDPFACKADRQCDPHVWDTYGPAMTVTHIRDVLATGRLRDGSTAVDRRLQDLAVMLEPFSRDGAYGRFFDGPASVDFSNDFVVIEEEELKQKPDLHLVVNLILLYRITRAMYETRDRKKLLIIDELKQQLGTTGEDDPVLAQVVEEAARRARKYGGALITATQGADDYYASAATTPPLTSPTGCSCCARSKSRSSSSIAVAASAWMTTRNGCCSRCAPSGGCFPKRTCIRRWAKVARLMLDPHTRCCLSSNRLEDNAPLDAQARGPHRPGDHRILAERASAYEAAGPSVALNALLIAGAIAYDGTRAHASSRAVDVAVYRWKEAHYRVPD
jgi:conjugal transfer ATP-binding protein TraC